MRALRLATARLRSEGGFTLTELLVGIMIALIVGAGGMGLLSIAVRAEPQRSERAGQIQQGRTMIERIGREMRQGETVLSPTASSFSVLTFVHSASCGGAPAPSTTFCRVTYSCGSASCTRTERNPDGTGTGSTSTAVTGITGPDVFSFGGSATDPSYVGVKLVYPAEDGSEAITLEDGAGLRNYFTSEGPA